jgi:hypothetical protein
VWVIKVTFDTDQANQKMIFGRPPFVVCWLTLLFVKVNWPCLTAEPMLIESQHFQSCTCLYLRANAAALDFDTLAKESPMVHVGIRSMPKTIRINTLRIAVVIGVTIFASAAVAFLAPSPASAKPEFAAQTGLPCGQCHVSPSGGGKLTAFGQKFKDNGFKIKK